MNLANEIKANALKIVAVERATDELKREQELLFQKINNPAPRVRTNKKQLRLEKISTFYLKRRIIQLSK